MKTLPLAERHLALGARFGEFAGWHMPLWYQGAVAEHLAVRRKCGVFDISHMGRLSIGGADAADVLCGCLSRDPSVLAPGASQYGLLCNAGGGIVDDLIVYRRGTEAFLVICNAANADTVAAILTRASMGRAATIQDVGPSTTLLAVQGPDARAVSAAILGDEVLAIARHGCADVSNAGKRYFCARGGYTGEDGFEIMSDFTAGGELLDALIDAGCAPCGLAARDSLRLEAALPLRGSDIDETTTPWDAGLGWAVELDHEFTGRDALEASKARVIRRLACLLSDGKGVFRHGQTVLNQGEAVGTLSSGGFSPMLDRSIAMAYLPAALAAPGTPLAIDLRGRVVECHVVKRPFYRHAAPSN